MEKSKEQKSLEKAYEQKVKEYTPTHCLGKEWRRLFLWAERFAVSGSGLL